MRMRCVVLLFALFGLSVAAYADLVVMDTLEIYQMDNLGVKSNFNADGGGGGGGLLGWSSGTYAKLRYDSSVATYRCIVSGQWDNMTDLSQGGLADASFATGGFTVTFFATSDPGKTNPLGSAVISLYSGWSYREGETAQNPSTLLGKAVVKIDSWTLPGYQWAEPIGSPAGLSATSSNLFGNLGNISDYQSDWWTNNTIVTVMADESAIPEPATMALLALGGLAVLSKKR